MPTALCPAITSGRDQGELLLSTAHSGCTFPLAGTWLGPACPAGPPMSPRPECCRVQQEQEGRAGGVAWPAVQPQDVVTAPSPPLRALRGVE